MDYYDDKLMRSGMSYKACGISFVGIIILLLFILCSCTTVKYVPVETVRTEYVTKTDTLIKKDSVFCHDSVYIHQKGDTVWYEKWHTRYIDRVEYKVRTDSFIKRDSIQIPYPVEKKLTKWQQAKVDWGGWAMLTLVVLIFIIVWLIVKKLQR